MLKSLFAATLIALPSLAQADLLPPPQKRPFTIACNNGDTYLSVKFTKPLALVEFYAPRSNRVIDAAFAPVQILPVSGNNDVSRMKMHYALSWTMRNIRSDLSLFMTLDQANRGVGQAQFIQDIVRTPGGPIGVPPSGLGLGCQTI